MFKLISFFSLSFGVSALIASQQLIVVLSEDLNATSGSMQRYEDEGKWMKVGIAIPVILGRSGLGWSHQEPFKNEGDGRSPAGLFPLNATFGYDEKANSSLRYYHADDTLICIDAVEDGRYNTLARLDPLNPPASFEKMHRLDDVYRNGAVIGYNPSGEKGRGSCIFIHLNHADRHPTSGCTAMDEEPLKELLGWLDGNKNPRILQIPKKVCREYLDEFPGIECE
ncbi:MAG: hypothetical protein PHW64_02135 [Sulfuricurvum sp.]|nr:hypothetical protein [Sulfuricurvum sp.]